MFCRVHARSVVLFTPRRLFLPWDKPLLPQAVALLAAGWKGPEPLDLSRVLVLVPTRQSGRRLREALAEYSAGLHSAVFPPRVLTPDALIEESRRPLSARGIASRLDALLAWVDVLLSVDLAEFQIVFPVDPPNRDFAWAFRLAERFVHLQTTLGENDLRIGEVADKAGADFPESDRWRQLSILEARYIERLEVAGLKPALDGTARDATAWLSGVGRIVVLATVDPMPAAIRLLEHALTKVQIEVAVFAPSTESDGFDAWGRPVGKVWESRVLLISDFEQRVHLCLDPTEQAQRVVALAKAYAVRTHNLPREGALAIGLADPEILPLTEAEAARNGLVTFNPEGHPRRQGALFHLIAALLGCARSSAFEVIEALVRCPDFLAYLARQGGPGFSSGAFLAGLDMLRLKHLPADLESAAEHAQGHVAEGLQLIAAIRTTLRQGDYPSAIAAVLAQIFHGRVLNPVDDADGQLQDAATEWTQTARATADAVRRFPIVRPNDAWDVALKTFGESRRTEAKTAGAFELQGWLELLFESAPHLVITGCNDGAVPEAVSEDAFLPESLRVRLGLKTNGARLARDAYLLQAVVIVREKHGRLDLLLGKTSSMGDPLRPSRLLLRCPDAELSNRVAFLFRTPEPAESHSSWTRAWTLRPPMLPPPSRIAVTALRRWLACPFRFYLRQVMRMESIDAGKSELDAFDFGSLCHAAFEALGGNPSVRDCTDPTILRDFLWSELGRRAQAQFGAELTLPLTIQLESARQRLAKFAELQARERATGWVIEAVERSFEVAIEGLVVKGKIDRIDRNLETGAVRVLDYKTSDSPVTPRAAHLRLVRTGEMLPDWAMLALEGKPRAWVDLQLPLYRHALAAEWGDALGCGYINLPKAVGQTALVLWDDYTLELQEHARRCAEGVCRAISAGEFWPPNEAIRADDDDFAALFHHGAAASIDWEPNRRIGIGPEMAS